MNDDTASEVYELADEALAHLHSIVSNLDTLEGENWDSAQTIEKNLELIRRRTDPAVREEA